MEPPLASEVFCYGCGRSYILSVESTSTHTRHADGMNNPTTLEMVKNMLESCQRERDRALTIVRFLGDIPSPD